MTLDFLSDRVIFLVVEVAIGFLFLFSLLMDTALFRKRSGFAATVKRGDVSWSQLYLAHGIISVVLMQIINVADTLQGYKVLVSVINLSIFFYLAFFSSWFRNFVITLVMTSKEKREW